MEIKLNRNNNTPIYLQIKNAIAQLILSGQLPASFKLPSERSIADDLGVSRTTMVRAYQELIAEGLVIVSAKPKGYFVREAAKKTPMRIFHPLAKMIRYTYTDKENLFDDLFSQSGTLDLISLAGINVNVAEEEDITYHYNDFVSLDDKESFRLKTNIRRILSKHDIFVGEKNIQLVAETTQVLEYISQLYLKEGDNIIVEEPVVASTVNVFRNRGINVICVRMTENGMDLDDLEKLLPLYQPKFIYTMPNLHNPTGIVMPLEHRMRLLTIAGHWGVPIIEENSVRDFRYDGKELPSLYALDNNQMVLYIDTFTLTFLPGNKIAYVVGPPEPIEMIGKLISTGQMTIYKMSHAMLNSFIESGAFERRVQFLQRYYRQKRDYLCRRLIPLVEKGLIFQIPEGGLCLWCKLPEDVNEKKLFALCKQRGVLYMPGSVFFPYGYSGSGYIRLCFSSASEQQIDRAVEILDITMELSKDNIGRRICETNPQFRE